MKHTLRNIGVILGTLLLTVCLAGGAWVQSFLSAMNVASTPSVTQTVMPTIDAMGNQTEVIVDVVDEEAAKYYDWDFGEDYINVLCIGVDARKANDFFGLTDVMIIASLDLTSHRIRLVSLMRDTYIKPAGYSGHTKLNSVMAAYGGIDELMRTINESFGTNLTKYAIVNFGNLALIIEALGGVYIDVQENEISSINECRKEVCYSLAQSLGPEVTEPGYQLLNGVQAVGYARIRNLGNGDFDRTSRQRVVMEGMLEQVKKMGILSWPSLFYSCKDLVKTNMSPDEILAAGIKVLQFRDVEIEELRIPMDGSWNYQTIDGLSYVVTNLNDSKRAITEFLVGNYVPPENQ